LHKFQKERRRNTWNSRGYFERGDTTHIITNYPKRKKYDYSSKNNYKKKNRCRDKKKKNVKKIMPRACAALRDFDFSNEDSTSLEEHEKVNYKKKEGDFIGL
jgi:hypothetical protein